ncbi:MAG: hypothetical protein MZV70_19450 [Desulfobacterales bacterium]|nr:hypothetical protein [Desulfobacterales bacterium]
MSATRDRMCHADEVRAGGGARGPSSRDSRTGRRSNGAAPVCGDNGVIRGWESTARDRRDG